MQWCIVHLCVGWIAYDANGFTSVPVMGVEQDIYPNYNGFLFVPWYFLIKNVKVDKATLPENYKDLVIFHI